MALTLKKYIVNNAIVKKRHYTDKTTLINIIITSKRFLLTLKVNEVIAS